MSPATPRLLAIRDRITALLREPDANASSPTAQTDVLEQIEAGLEQIATELGTHRAANGHVASRIAELGKMMGAIVAFDFSARVPVGEKGDHYDGFASSLNMMAEELSATTVSSEFIDNILQSMTEPVVVFDPGGRIIAVNRAACKLTGYAGDDLKGFAYQQLFSEPSLHEIIKRGHLEVPETRCAALHGESLPVSLSASVLLNKMGELQGVVCVARDLRELRKTEEERWQLREAMHRQSVLLEELSTPLIPISEQIVVLPLIGTVDDSRAKQLCETLLNGIKQLRVQVAIIDLTGVRTLDQAAIQGLLRAIRGVRLLGAEVVLTGIRPQLATALVNLGADIAGIATTGSLQAGIQDAVRQLAGSPKRRTSGSEQSSLRFSGG